MKEEEPEWESLSVIMNALHTHGVNVVPDDDSESEGETIPEETLSRNPVSSTMNVSIDAIL